MNKNREKTFAYLGPLKHSTSDDQLADCRRIVQSLGLPLIGRRVYEHPNFHGFLDSLHGSEYAVLPTLEVLGGERGRGVSRRFYGNLGAIERKGTIIIDAKTGTCSNDKEWQALVDKVAGALINGRELKSAKASEMVARKGSLVSRWINKKASGAPEYLQAAKIWGDLSIKPAELAIERMPDKELRGASKGSIQLIFGSRKVCSEWVANQTKIMGDKV